MRSRNRRLCKNETELDVRDSLPTLIVATQGNIHMWSQIATRPQAAGHAEVGRLCLRRLCRQGVFPSPGFRRAASLPFDIMKGTQPRRPYAGLRGQRPHAQALARGHRPGTAGNPGPSEAGQRGGLLRRRAETGRRFGERRHPRVARAHGLVGDATAGSAAASPRPRRAAVDGVEHREGGRGQSVLPTPIHVPPGDRIIHFLRCGTSPPMEW